MTVECTPTAVGRPDLDPVTAAVVSAVEAALRSPSIGLTGGQALERLRALTVVGSKVTALQAESVRDMTRRELYALDGAGSTGGWLRQQDNPVLPGASPSCAGKLQRLPRVEQAVRDGLLAPRSAEVLARALESVPDNPALLQPGALQALVLDGVPMVLAEVRGGALDDDGWASLHEHLAEIAESGAGVHDQLEQAFLVIAEQLPHGQLAAALARLVDAIRPEVLDEQEQTAHDLRSATLRRNPDGHGWRLTAELDDETGELCSKLFTAFDRIERDSGLALQGIVRSKTQRRHDALSAAVRFALESGDVPADGGVRPHITITVSQDQLAGVAAALPAVSDTGCDIARQTLARWLCDSELTLLLTGHGGHALDVGRSWRTATPKQRIALRAQWAGCAVHGCGRGWKRVTPHHVVPWSLGGATDLTNLIPVCDGCHRDVHEDRRHLRLTDNRWIGPEGWVTGPPT